MKHSNNFHLKFFLIFTIAFPLSIIPVTFGRAPNSFVNSHINPNFEEGIFDDDNVPPFNSGSVSMCLPNYEISEGSIIRTKDSIELGARFLNESDMGASVNGKEECLRLCCKTPYCNVAVFQEKGSGSCYMFDCGPPEDFRCKFTSQIQYMSGILRRKEIIQVPSNQHSQHSSPNANNGNGNPTHNQHEAELSQLRSRGDEGKGPKILANMPAVNGRSDPTSNIGPSTTSASASLSLLENSPRCSRWQFECKSSKECIAIYNVCDGITNCPDGSDEENCPPPGPIHPHQQNPSSAISQASGPGPGQSSPNVVGHTQGKEHGNGDRIFNHKDGGLLMDQTFGNQLQQQKHNNAYMKPNYDYPTGEQLRNNYGPQNYGQNEPLGNNNAYNNGAGTFGQSYGYNTFPNPNLQQGPGLNLPQFSGQQNMNGNSQQYQVPPILQQQQYFGGKGQQIPIPQQPPIMVPGAGAGAMNNAAKQGEIESMSSQGVQPQNQQANQATTIPPQAKPSISSTGSGEKNGKPVTDSDKAEKPSTKEIEESEDKAENEILKRLKNQGFNADAEAAAIHLDSDESSPHKAGAGAVFLFIVGLGMMIVMTVIVGCRLRRLSVGGRRRRRSRLDGSDYLVDGMYL